jgi:hypothetical protein
VAADQQLLFVLAQLGFEQRRIDRLLLRDGIGEGFALQVLLERLLAPRGVLLGNAL